MNTKFTSRGTLMKDLGKVDAATKTDYETYETAYNSDSASSATSTAYTAYKIKEDAFLADGTKLNSDKKIITDYYTAKAKFDASSAALTYANSRSADAAAGITHFEGEMNTWCKAGFTTKVLSTAN